MDVAKRPEQLHAGKVQSEKGGLFLVEGISAPQLSLRPESDRNTMEAAPNCSDRANGLNPARHFIARPNERKKNAKRQECKCHHED